MVSEEHGNNRVKCEFWLPPYPINVVNGDALVLARAWAGKTETPRSSLFSRLPLVKRVIGYDAPSPVKFNEILITPSFGRSTTASRCK